MGRMQFLKTASSAASRLLRPHPSVLETSSWCLAGVSRERNNTLTFIKKALPETRARGLASFAIRPPHLHVTDATVDASNTGTFGVSCKPTSSSNVSPTLSKTLVSPHVPVHQPASQLGLQQFPRKAPLSVHSLGTTSSFTFASRSLNTDSQSPTRPSVIEVDEGEDEDEGSWEDGDDGENAYDTILAEVLDGGHIGLLTIDRPEVLNALSSQVMLELADALQEFDADPEIKVIVLTGSGDKAFAAGADIKEMRDQDFVSAYSSRLLSGYEAATSACRKPIIAAVNGYALGGGCELAMMCDVILAGENAVFGQPETNLGVIPGMGGTQRLIRAVGKSRAMEMILSGGHFIKAEEAVARGLASRVVPGDSEQLLNAAVDLARAIARKSVPVIAMAKQAVNSANDLPLSEGVKKENLLFSACFGLQDQKEGMAAFLEKRKPKFEDK